MYGTLYLPTIFIIFLSISPADISLIIEAPEFKQVSATLLLNVSIEIMVSGNLLFTNSNAGTTLFNSSFSSMFFPLGLEL